MDTFFIIAGLGNPGRKYDGSRHNVGFDVIDELVDRYHIGGPERFGKSMIGRGRIGDRKVILVKPMTYMNLSGEAVQEIVHYFKVDPARDLVVISDDIDLEPGVLRIRKKGSAGSHNGLKNIVQHLGTGDFPRIRIGVGAKPDSRYDLADYVLGHFTGDEKKIMEEAVAKAAEAVACMANEGVEPAMNRYNTPRKKKEKKEKTDARQENPQLAQAESRQQESPQSTQQEGLQIPDPESPQLAQQEGLQIPDPESPQLAQQEGPQIPDPESPQLAQQEAPQRPDPESRRQEAPQRPDPENRRQESPQPAQAE